MPESAWLIPDDWTLETGEWTAYCIRWPESEEWEIMMRSVLYTFTRGREWDRDSGSIRTAQKIGWQIFDRNNPLVPCEDCPDCPDCPDSGSPVLPSDGVGSSVIMESEDMGQVVTDVKIENGQLVVYFGPCCTHTFDLSASITEGGETVPDDIFDPLLPEGATYSACGRAAAVHAAVSLAVDSMWDERLNPNIFQWIGHVEQNVGLGNLSNNAVLSGVTYAIALDVVLGGEDIFDESKLQRALCSMAEVFQASNTNLSDDEWGAIFSAYQYAFGVYVGGIFVYAIRAIGRGTMSTVAKGGAVNQSANCGCPGTVPEEETEPDAQGWFLSQNYADQMTDAGIASGWGKVVAYIEALEPVYGAFLVLSAIPTGTIKRMNIDNAEGAYTPDAFDKTLWGSTSDHLETANNAYPNISALSTDIRTSLAAQRGFAGNINGGTGGIDSAVIASPEGLTGEIIGVRIDYSAPAAWLTTFEVLELRFVHNVNHP